MGMMCEGALYVDTCLPFGLRSAPKFFTAIADAVEWIVRQEEASGITHNLDDFLVVGASNSLERAATLTTLLRVFDQLGLPVAHEKLEGPLSCLVFELDSEAMVIRLPQLKLGATISHQVLGRSTVMHKERPGWKTGSCQSGGTTRDDLHEKDVRAACRDLVSHHHIHLSKAFRSDLL